MVLVIAGSLAAVPAPMHAGLFDVSIGFDVYATRDDNILLMSDEEKEVSSIDPIDEILQIRPHLKVNYHGKRSSVRFQYELFKEWYKRYHPLDRTPQSYHDGSILFAYELTERITLGLFDNYKDSLYGATRFEIPDVRDDYLTNTLEPSIKYSDMEDRWRMILSGRWTLMDYEEDPLQNIYSDYGFADWDEYGGRLNVNLALRTRTRFIATGSLWIREYVHDEVAVTADQSGYTVDAGISQEMGEGATVTILAQYAHRKFDNEGGREQNEYDNIGGSISFSNQFSGISRLEVELFSHFDGSERISRAFYRNTGIRSVFYTQVSHRVDTGLHFSYFRMNYDNVDEGWNDNYLQAGVKIGYQISNWLSLRGQYIYTYRDSEAEFGNFDNNLISLYLQFRHNFFY
jgi:hypothetical protein